MNKLIIEFEIPGEIANTCCKSIRVETKNGLNRSKIHLDYDDSLLRIRIESEDLHALRAALNTYFRWIIMCYDLLSNNTTNGTNS